MAYKTLDKRVINMNSFVVVVVVFIFCITKLMFCVLI